jgi:Mn-containing catalase
MKAFTLALESLGKNPFSIGRIEPTPGLVDEYFNDSTGVGDDGEKDATGPWNSGGQWKIVEARELQMGVENLESSAGRKRGGEQEKLKRTA